MPIAGVAFEDVLGSEAVNPIQTSGQFVFHAVGDTGGIKEPRHQFAVADAMPVDLAGKTLATDRLAFLFHLGDVVYYFGQDRFYYDQFYEPYTRTMKQDARHIAYVVAGTGGYFNLSGFKTGRGGVKPRPGAIGRDTQANQVTLEHFDDATFGFLRVAVTATTITCQFVAVDERSRAARVTDTATVALATHKVT